LSQRRRARILSRDYSQKSLQRHFVVYFFRALSDRLAQERHRLTQGRRQTPRFSLNAGRRHDFRLSEAEDCSRLPTAAEDCSLLHPVDGQSLVYRRAVKVSPQQMRAAIESLPCENPELSAVAIASMNERDFALRLERAIARSERAKLIEARAVNADDNG
jgi:hypothetical protein